MNPLKDYYSYLTNWKKYNKNKNFKKSLVKCPYCNSLIKGNSLKYHMTEAHKSIEKKYKRLDKYSQINIRNNYSDVSTNNNNKANHILKYMDNININDISKNNNFSDLNDIIKKKNRTTNSNNSLENNIDSLGIKFNLTNSNINQGVDNIKEYNCIETSFDFKEKSIEDDKKNTFECYKFKHEYLTNNGKITEEFIIQGNKIISNLNKEETEKRIFQEMSKMCNYFLNYNKYEFTHQEIIRKPKIITNKKTFNSKKRNRVEKYENLEDIRNALINLKNKGYL